MSDTLTATSAIVTGASSGIGRGIALDLAASGASVALVARRGDRLKELAAEIEAAGGTAMLLETDLTTAQDAAAVVDRAVAGFGRLDTVVNAAGVMLIGDSADSPLEHWERMVDVNLKALMYVTKAAIPHLLAAVGTGSRQVADVVNISSVAGRVASPTAAIYNATKFAVTAATEAWRQEYATRSLRFSTVEPGAVGTELGRHQESTQAWYDQMRAGGSMLLAEDIAAAVHYIVTAPSRVAVNEIVIRPTQQA